jgi:signal transduction histidine kinase
MSIDALLTRRPSRPPDHAAESRALAALAEMFSSPEQLLREVAFAACQLCGAGSAAITLLEPDGHTLRCHVAAGQLANLTEQTGAASGTPSSLVIERAEPMLFIDPSKHHSLPSDSISEALIVPLQVDGTTIGTFGICAHDHEREFDVEDLRVLTTLARFACAAHRMAAALSAAEAKHLEAETAVSARTELARRLSTSQEDERRRFARDLHDSIGQSALALALGIDAVASTGPLPPPAVAALSEIRRVADALGREVHELALKLRPTALDDLGLHAALAQHIAAWSARSGVNVDFHSAEEEVGRLPPELETVLYRVVQEALTNVLKHAHAHHVSVVVERHDGRVIAIVEDDGRGFDSTSPASGNRLGLLGMRERVTLAGGTLEVESEPGRGTSVISKIPLAK